MAEERTKVWIDKFQTRLFLRMGWYWVIYQVALWNLVFLWRLVHEGEGNLLEQYGRFCLDYAPALVGSVIVLPFLAWDAVKFAHRAVGPIFRIRQSMRALAAGEMVRVVKLRQADFLTEMQDDFNGMLEAFQRRGVPVLEPLDAAGADAKRQPA
jgi:methyl-accepting chemotaxis protein